MAKSEFDDLVSSPSEDCNCECHDSSPSAISSTSSIGCIHCKPAIQDQGDSTSLDWSRSKK